MKLIKKLNNNFALASDTKGKTIIVEGKGIGFQKMPCVIQDLSCITRTYYDTKEQDISLIKSVSEDVLLISSQIFDYANQHIGSKLNPNLPFILADHIQFSIERYEKNMNIQMPIYYDIEHFYPEENKIADYAMKLIRTQMGIPLPDSEKTGITLNIINSEINVQSSGGVEKLVIELCINIIETKMGVLVDRNSFSFSRLVSHLEYLLRRAKKLSEMSEGSAQLYEKISESFPEIKECVDEIASALSKKKFYLNNEEKLYLILHVHRICDREDCNQ